MIRQIVSKIKLLFNDFKSKSNFYSYPKSILLTVSPYCPYRGQYLHQEILKYIEREYTNTITLYKHSDRIKENNENIPAIVWIMWWQGESQMPLLVKKCYETIKQNSEGKDVILITHNNLSNFLELPQYILEKVNAGKISITHLSDIIRMGLLSKYGGLWIDATIYLTDKIEFPYKSFFTIRQHLKYDRYVLGGNKWTPYLLGSTKNHLLPNFAFQFFLDYWKKEDNLIDYFLVDYVIATAYKSFDEIHTDIDRQSYQYENIYLLSKNLNSLYNENYINSNSINKLSYKKPYQVINNGKLTNYGYITK